MEIFGGNNVDGGLRPGNRRLDSLELKNDLSLVIDDGRSALCPLDLLIRMDAGSGKKTRKNNFSFIFGRLLVSAISKSNWLGSAVFFISPLDRFCLLRVGLKNQPMP
jgi:hypothetical protein